MRSVKRIDQYLRLRRGTWHYARYLALCETSSKGRSTIGKAQVYESLARD